MQKKEDINKAKVDGLLMLSYAVSYMSPDSVSPFSDIMGKTPSPPVSISLSSPSIPSTISGEISDPSPHPRQNITSLFDYPFPSRIKQSSIKVENGRLPALVDIVVAEANAQRQSRMDETRFQRILGKHSSSTHMNASPMNISNILMHNTDSNKMNLRPYQPIQALHPSIIDSSSSLSQTRYENTRLKQILKSYATGVTEEEEKKHSCPHSGCKKSFKRSEHLRRHFRIHTGERNFHCDFPGCLKSFSRSDNLHQHQKTHTKQLNTSQSSQ